MVVEMGARFNPFDAAPVPSPCCGMTPDEKLEELIAHVRRIRHDANNPLTAALGHVQLLLTDPAVQDAEVLESLRVVENELRRLIEILRQLSGIGQ
jgi:signal transduction histidine kinase